MIYSHKLFTDILLRISIALIFILFELVIATGVILRSLWSFHIILTTVQFVLLKNTQITQLSDIIFRSFCIFVLFESSEHETCYFKYILQYPYSL